MNDLLVVLFFVLIFLIISNAINRVLTIESGYTDNIRKMKYYENITLN